MISYIIHTIYIRYHISTLEVMLCMLCTWRTQQSEAKHRTPWASAFSAGLHVLVARNNAFLVWSSVVVRWGRLEMGYEDKHWLPWFTTFRPCRAAASWPDAWSYERGALPWRSSHFRESVSSAMSNWHGFWCSLCLIEPIYIKNITTAISTQP